MLNEVYRHTFADKKKEFATQMTKQIDKILFGLS